MVEKPEFAKKMFVVDYHNDTKFWDIQLLANSVDPYQSAQGLHCLPFCLHLLDILLYGKTTSFQFWNNYSNIFGCLIFFRICRLCSMANCFSLFDVTESIYSYL